MPPWQGECVITMHHVNYIMILSVRICIISSVIFIAFKFQSWQAHGIMLELDNMSTQSMISSSWSMVSNALANVASRHGALALAPIAAYSMLGQGTAMLH